MSEPCDQSPPRVFILDGPHLLATRSRVFAADPALGAADARLLQQAEEAAETGPFSVTDKAMAPPSGDRHDYMSFGPYWWPDPDQPGGLPYVRRDGEVNPESRHVDRQPLGAMCGAVNTLALAYFYSDHERFAEQAALLLRTWFLQESTRMNPHLQYGQAIPGRCDGRGIGIIDTLQLASLVDSVGLLAASAAWTSDDEAGLREWCAAYLEWLVDSEHGRDESSQPNNHATWYDVQVLSLALYSGRAEIGAAIAEKRVFERLESQVEPDGRQPLEMARTRSLGYSVSNLLGFYDLADLSRHYGQDLWGYESGDGRSLTRALEWILERAIGGGTWPGEQIAPFESTWMLPLLLRGAVGFGRPDLADRVADLEGADAAADRTVLLYPSPKR